MRYRKAKNADTQLIKEILSSNNLPSSDIDAHILNFVVAVDEGGKIVAVGGLQVINDMGLVRSIAVIPEQRRKEIAKKIYMQIESNAIKSGIKILYLLTESAAGYFLRLGFAPQDRNKVPKAIMSTRQFSEICPASAIVMYRNISDENGK